MYELASWAISQCSGKLELNIAKKDIRMTFAKSNKDIPDINKNNLGIQFPG